MFDLTLPPLASLLHSSGKYLMVHQTAHLHEVRTSLPFNNSIRSFGWHIPSHHREVLQSKESRRQSLTKAFHLSLSCLMRRIQLPCDNRTPVKNGPCLTNFATHCGGYIVSLFSRSFSQQLARFLSSHLLSTNTFRRG